jgi:hypothetical protein
MPCGRTADPALQPRPLPSAKNNGTCEPAHIFFAASVLFYRGSFLRESPGATEMTSFHGDFAFQGVDPWHARIKGASFESLGINGIAFPRQAIRFACPDKTVRVGDANIDRAEPRQSRDTSGIQLASIA